MSRLPSSRRARAVLALLVVLVILFVAGVIPPKSSTAGSSGSGSGGSGGLSENVDWTGVGDKIGALFGTSMISAEPQNDTLQIKVVDGFGASGVNLFCTSIRKIITDAGGPADTKVEIHDSKSLLSTCSK